MPSQLVTTELTRRFQTAIKLITDRAAAAVIAAWDRLPAYDESDVAGFVRVIQPAVQGSKASTMRLASGYYSSILDVPPPVVRLDQLSTLFDPEAGFKAAWHALKQGRSYQEATAAGRSMTEASVSNAVVSTGRRTGDIVTNITGQRVVGWRRVLDGKACHWCQLVSTQRYKTAESADFGHHRCGCTAVPIIGDNDPGRVINQELLKRLKSGEIAPPVEAAPRLSMSAVQIQTPKYEFTDIDEFHARADIRGTIVTVQDPGGRLTPELANQLTHGTDIGLAAMPSPPDRMVVKILDKLPADHNSDIETHAFVNSRHPDVINVMRDRIETPFSSVSHSSGGAAQVTPATYKVVHETGHSNHFRTGDITQLGPASANAGRISQYAKASSMEEYAEGFALFAIRGEGTLGNAEIIAGMAEKYGWLAS